MDIATLTHTLLDILDDYFPGTSAQHRELEGRIQAALEDALTRDPKVIERLAVAAYTEQLEATKAALTAKMDEAIAKVRAASPDVDVAAEAVRIR